MAQNTEDYKGNTTLSFARAGVGGVGQTDVWCILSEQTHLVLLNLYEKESNPLATDLKCTFHVATRHLATGIPNRAWQAAEAAVFPTLTWSLQ